MFASVIFTTYNHPQWLEKTLWGFAAQTYRDFEIIVAEVLLQRTQAAVVAEFFPKFVRKYPSWKQLAEASEEDLRNLLAPIGLARR